MHVPQWFLSVCSLTHVFEQLLSPVGQQMPPVLSEPASQQMPPELCWPIKQHTPPSLNSPIGQHLPLEHVSVPVHALPQVPQLPLSVFGFVHAPPQ